MSDVDPDAADGTGTAGSVEDGVEPDDTGADAAIGTERHGDSDRSADEADEIDGETPVEVGDGREKHVEVTERSGERTEHFQVYLRHTTDEFVVSPDDAFPTAETTRYAKADLLRVEINQHHSMCFITTATVGDGETLDSLRAFREDAFRPRRAGRALLGVYERISPPVARTLGRHPAARTTRLVRRLVEHGGALARRHDAASSRSYRGVLALALTLVYVVGVCCALVGHGTIRLREMLADDTVTDASA